MTVGGAGPLVVFDCDGVLVDSEVLVTVIEAELLAEVGVDLTPHEIAELFVGLSDARMHELIEQRWGVALDEDFGTRKDERIREALTAELEPVPGIGDVLAALDAVRVARCVASSSHPDRIRRSLERTGLARWFGPHLFSASMVSRGKPAPDLFLHAAAALGVEPGGCVVVEDSPFGIEAGVAAGMAVIGFTAGGHCPPSQADRLRDAGAHHVAATAIELDAALRTWLDRGTLDDVRLDDVRLDDVRLDDPPISHRSGPGRGR